MPGLQQPTGSLEIAGGQINFVTVRTIMKLNKLKKTKIKSTPYWTHILMSKESKVEIF